MANEKGGPKSAFIRLRGRKTYSNTTITTLRFSALPFFVLFDAAGSVSPYEIVDMRFRGSWAVRER